MLQTAILVTFMYWALISLDGLTSFQTIQRPIVMAMFTGLVLGDLQTGIIMGGLLEAVFMGVSGIGGAKPAQPQVSTVFVVTLAIMTEVDVATAVALAMPFGTLATTMNNFWKPIYVLFEPSFEKMAAEGKPDQFFWAHVAFCFTLRPMAMCIVLFASVWAGTGAAEAILSWIPANVMNGVQAAGELLPIVGYGILAHMLWTQKKHLIWLFLGFLTATYLGVPTLALAGFAAIIAIIMLMRDIEIHNLRESAAAAVDEKEDFLNG
jgi:PTS system mannose-specific IIC component